LSNDFDLNQVDFFTKESHMLYLVNLQGLHGTICRLLEVENPKDYDMNIIEFISDGKDKLPYYVKPNDIGKLSITIKAIY